MGNDERAGRVPHVHAAGREPLELAGAAFDAVEPLADVEPAERDISGLEEPERVARDEDLRSRDPRHAAAATSAIVRLAAPMGDDGELHAEIVRGRRRPWASIW